MARYKITKIKDESSLSDSSGYNSSPDNGRFSLHISANVSYLYSSDDPESKEGPTLPQTETIVERCMRLNVPVDKCPNCPVMTYRNIMKFHLEVCPHIPVRKGTTRGTISTKMMSEKFKPFLKSYEQKKKLTFLYRKTKLNQVEIVGQKYGNGDPVFYSLTLYDRENRHIFKSNVKSGNIIFIPKFVFEELGKKVKFKITTSK